MMHFLTGHQNSISGDPMLCMGEVYHNESQTEAGGLAQRVPPTVTVSIFVVVSVRTSAPFRYQYKARQTPPLAQASTAMPRCHDHSCSALLPRVPACVSTA